MPFETIHSDTTYRGKAFSIRRDRIALPDGRTAELDIVDHVGAVTLLPLDDVGQVWFVRQYRHATKRFLLELPAGTLEPGEPPEQCAHREIREEIGMASRQLRLLGEFFLAPGYSTEYMYIYLATGLFPAPLPGDQDEFLSIEKIPLEQVHERVRNGDIRDAKSLAAFYLFQM